MTPAPWIINALGQDRVRQADDESSRRRLSQSLGLVSRKETSNERLRFISNALVLRVIDLLDADDRVALSIAASDAFQVARVLPIPAQPVAAAEALLRLGCLGVIGDRGADVRRLLGARFPDLPTESDDWGTRVWSTILDAWLRLFRKDGWGDLDSVKEGVAGIRATQSDLEPVFLQRIEQRGDARPAWQLVSDYHLARAAEILGEYTSLGSAEGRFDIQQQLDAQFDRALAAASEGQLIEREMLVRLLAPAAAGLASNTIWMVARAVNSRVSDFVKSLTDRKRSNPILEMFPPQRLTLREQGLLGSGRRSVVVVLPTSSGKTFIAEFRILQALNQFDRERGWVAYLAPTRSLVNQVTRRLQRDFGAIGLAVEKVSPALEVDGHEASMLAEPDEQQQFRVLVATPEKLDLMLRGGWEARIGRPLTLVVVDEAHGIGVETRGLKLELLLATINRECRFAQFLLLTPFVPNAEEIARWLAPDSNASIGLSLDWQPNDRAIVIVSPRRGDRRGEFRVQVETQHTTRKTIDVPELLEFDESRPLGLSWSDVSNSRGKLAAATANLLPHRGTVVILVGQPRHSWSVARILSQQHSSRQEQDDDVWHVKEFLKREMGPDFPLVPLLDHGIGVHHAGLSDDARILVEWLTEHEKLRVLVATTTLAQGVNFPISAVVFASHQYPYGRDMPAADFWNIAGRAGRVDQADLGIVALTGRNDSEIDGLRTYIQQSVGNLNSTLVEMVQSVSESGQLLQLHEVAWRPEWSAFLQYLAHTYRQLDDHDRFATEIEQILRGTLGFEALRKSHPGWADQLVRGVRRYAERIEGEPLQLVDATGLSWESVSNTLRRIQSARLTDVEWTPAIFGTRRDDLRRIMGVLLEVPELRQSLGAPIAGSSPDGNTLAQIICDWVRGRSLAEIAKDHFSVGLETRTDSSDAAAMTRCCQTIFQRLTQTASWGIAALQSLTIGSSLEKLAESERRSIRNLPARVYYGVNSDEAVAMRVLGVPRTAAERLARQLDVSASEPLHRLRTRVSNADTSQWTAALGEVGASYRRVWSIIQHGV